MTPVPSQIYMERETRMEMKQQQTKTHAYPEQGSADFRKEGDYAILGPATEAISENELQSFCLLATREAIIPSTPTQQSASAFY